MLRPSTCLLLPVSWLFVALIPGLLMLATFGLERLESTLNRGSVAAADVAEFLAQARPGDMGTLARDGMPAASDASGDLFAEPLPICSRGAESAISSDSTCQFCVASKGRTCRPLD